MRNGRIQPVNNSIREIILPKWYVEWYVESNNNVTENQPNTDLAEQNYVKDEGCAEIWKVVWHKKIKMKIIRLQSDEHAEQILTSQRNNN